MNAPITSLRPADMVLPEAAAVVEVRDGVCTVETRSGQLEARRAVSCLVEPEAGDRVLLAAPEGGGVYVLAVLERPGSTAARLCPPGDLTVRLDRGKLVVIAAEGVDLVSPKDLSTTTGGVRVRAGSAQVFVDCLTYLGQKVLAESEQVKTVIGLCDSVLDRLSQRVKRCYRYVEECDHLRAEQVDYVAKQNLRLRGRNALINAEELVKVDGDQIHLG